MRKIIIAAAAAAIALAPTTLLAAPVASAAPCAGGSSSACEDCLENAAIHSTTNAFCYSNTPMSVPAYPGGPPTVVPCIGQC